MSCLFYFTPPPFFFLNVISSFCSFYCHRYCFSTTGPHAAHAQVLHPTEVGLYRQALLLWRGDQREVSADKDTRRGSSRALNRWPTRTMCEGKMNRSPILEQQGRSGSRWRCWVPQPKSCCCIWLRSLKIGFNGDRWVLKVLKLPGLCIYCSKWCE